MSLVLWQRQWLDNYHGRSEESKSLKTDLKQNYKGNSYIPWATMERLLLTQDPSFDFEKVKNENGGLVHTESFEIEQYAQDGATVKHTKSTSFSHFVKVRVIFLGKEVIEDYPIQNNDYTAPKVLDQNLVNRALQRAFAKAASRVSGIGFALYESLDLQFDDSEPQAVQGNKKVTKKEKPVIVAAEVKEVVKTNPEPKKEEVKETVVKEEVKEVKKTPVVKDELKEVIQEAPAQEVTAEESEAYSEIVDIYNKFNEDLRVGTLRKVNQVLINAKVEANFDINGNSNEFIGVFKTLDKNIQENLLKYIKNNLEKGKVL